VFVDMKGHGRGRLARDFHIEGQAHTKRRAARLRSSLVGHGRARSRLSFGQSAGGGQAGFLLRVPGRLACSTASRQMLAHGARPRSRPVRSARPATERHRHSSCE
jgi:hypothetical protein